MTVIVSYDKFKHRTGSEELFLLHIPHFYCKNTQTCYFIMFLHANYMYLHYKVSIVSFIVSFRV